MDAAAKPGRLTPSNRHFAVHGSFSGTSLGNNYVGYWDMIASENSLDIPQEAHLSWLRVDYCDMNLRKLSKAGHPGRFVFARSL